jgi:hypothetical protein
MVGTRCHGAAESQSDLRHFRPVITSRFDTILGVAEIAASRNTQQNVGSRNRAMWARTRQTDHFFRFVFAVDFSVDRNRQIS